MTQFTKAEQVFLYLYRRALWEDVPLEASRAQNADKPTDTDAPDNVALPGGSIDEATWRDVVSVAEAQTCQGLLADALVQLPTDKRPSKALYFSVLNVAARAESINQKMNDTLCGLFPMLQRKGIRAWLLKGQGLAQCYPQPLHRMAGDIDVFMPYAEEFDRAVKLFECRLPGKEHEPDHHRTFFADGITIELHGKINTHLNNRICRTFPAWLGQQMERQTVEWGDVTLPPVSFDAVYVFMHLVAHYVGGGIGLRQLADWMRFLYAHREGSRSPIDRVQLERDVTHLGLRRLWHVFACIAVTYLGCPADVMPLYDARYRREAAMVLRCIFDEGNFGHHDAAMKYRPKGFMAGKAFSFLVQSRRMMWNMRVFPRETLFCFPLMVRGGLERVLRRE